MRITRMGPGDADHVRRASALFDHPVRDDATERFLNSADHHLLLAFAGEEAVGMVTGVELTHPDKGVEMFLYELGVDDAHRNQGIGRALVTAQADLARERGCYGMWVLTDDDNPAAIRAYTAAGGGLGDKPRSLDWTFETADEAAAH
jgi:ribosomal protein S18 acetylase RimI-like enzyme